MILGFAHLAINAADIDQAAVAWGFYGYTTVAVHRGEPNHPSKQPFCVRYQGHHDLMLLKGPDIWPLEVTCHGPLTGSNKQIAWAEDAIRISVTDPEALQCFFVDALGFRHMDNNTIQLDSRLPGWSCRLKIERGVSKPVLLDAEGATCLAFYCNRIEEDALALIQQGANEYTGIFDVTLDQKRMSIAMMRLPGGPLLELINPRSRAS
jgi:hypothetical protein